MLRRCAAIRFARSLSPGDRGRKALRNWSEKLRFATDSWQRPELRTVREEQGIYCFERPRAMPRVMFLFPGQGSQYPGMLESLVKASPAAAAALAEADCWFAAKGLANFAQLAWRSTTDLGTDIWCTQLAMLVADLLVYAALQERGIEPDCLASHSFGEFPALVAAGAWSMADALDATRARAAGIVASHGSQGVMLSAGTTPAEIEALARLHDLDVFVTHHNAPCQTVVGGEREAISKLTDLLQRHGIDSRLLSVPGAFHTPLCEMLRPVCTAGWRALPGECRKFRSLAASRIAPSRRQPRLPRTWSRNWLSPCVTRK